jgi:hypothetical protein
MLPLGLPPCLIPSSNKVAQIPKNWPKSRAFSKILADRRGTVKYNTLPLPAKDKVVQFTRFWPRNPDILQKYLLPRRGYISHRKKTRLRLGNPARYSNRPIHALPRLSHPPNKGRLRDAKVARRVGDARKLFHAVRT